MSTQVGSISINSDEIMSSVEIIDGALATLQGNMTSKIHSDFAVLKETNLFSFGIDKIEKQIESLTTSSSNLITKLVSHTNEYNDFEASIENLANNYESADSLLDSNGSNGRNYPTGGGYHNSYNTVNSYISDVNEGNVINKTPIMDELVKLNTDTATKLINFLSIYKNNDLTYKNLLFDSNSAEILYTLLKKMCGKNDTNIDSSGVAESYTVQKYLLNMLLNNKNSDIVKMTDNSILVVKDYLNDIAKENNIKLEELILDNKNSEVLRSALNNLYTGNDISKYNVKSNDLSKFKNLVDSLAEKNNLSSSAILSDKKYLSMLKRM